MSIGIDNNYNSYYTQVSNNTKSNVGKTIVDNTRETNKTVSQEEYFKNLCSKYPEANINMSDSYLMKKNEVAFNFSPKLIEKAINDPKAAKNLDRLINLIPSTQQDFSTPKYTPDGRQINSVSFVVDENGGVSCKIKVEEKNSNNTSKRSDEEELREKKRKELKERAKALKEAQEEKLKGTKEYKVSNYYKNIATNSDMNLLDTFDTNI
jgi:hypothetical protein